MRSNARCHISECSRPPNASRSVSSDRSRPAEKCSPSASRTTAATPVGGALKKASMPSTVVSSNALRFADRHSRSTATTPCRSTWSEGGRSSVIGVLPLFAIRLVPISPPPSR